MTGIKNRKAGQTDYRAMEEEGREFFPKLRQDLDDPLQSKSWGAIISLFLRTDPTEAPLERLLQIFFDLSLKGKRSAAKILKQRGLSEKHRPAIEEIQNRIFKDAKIDEARPDWHLINLLRQITFTD